MTADETRDTRPETTSKNLIKNIICNMTLLTLSEKPSAPGRIRGENIGSPLKGWAPLDPTTALFSWYFKEIMLGFVVCFTQTPLTIAFALSAHIDPSQGLHSAWILGVICAIFGGRPAMINGFSGSSTSVIKTFLPAPVDGKTVGEGIEYMYASIILTGCLMFLFGLLRLGDRTINLVGSSVMIGFNCGLAITICQGQFQFYEHKVCELNETTGEELCQKEFIQGATAVWMAVITIAVMIIVEYFPLLGKRFYFIRYVPAPLVGIFAAIIIEYAIVRTTGSRTPNVADVAKFSTVTRFPEPFWIQTLFYDKSKFVLDSQGWGKIFSQGILLFFIGTIESLMVIQMMDGFTATVGNNNQQIAVLGIANVASGFLGSLGGDAMIGMSILNGLNGAQGRVSSLACGLGIMILMMAAFPVLNFIPVSALGGIMFVVCIHIFKWYAIDMVICAFVPAKLRVMLRLPSRKVNRADVIIIVAIVLLTYFYNLFYGIIAGVGFSFFIFMIQVKISGGTWAYIRHALNDSIQAERIMVEYGNRVIYIVKGPLYFKSFRMFPKLFDYYNDPSEITIYMEDGKLYDYSSLEGINKVCKEYKFLGKSAQVMNLSEKSKHSIRKADGSRSYGCCPLTFQWLLGDIQIAPEAKEVESLNSDEYHDEKPINGFIPSATINFLSQEEIESTPTVFVVNEIVPH